MNFRHIFIFGIVMLSLMGSGRVQAQESMKESDQLDFAQGLLSRGMYDMAIVQYQKFIAEYPHSSSLQEAYLSLGEGYFLSQEFDKAIEAFNQFKQLYPNSDQLPMSLLRLAQIDIEQKKYDDAIKELTSIDVQKQLKGKMLQAFDFYMAQAYKGKMDIPSTLDYFDKTTLVEGASDYSADAFKEIGIIQEQGGHYPEAKDAYTKALPLAQEDALKAELIYRTAEVDFLSEKYTDAIQGFGHVIDQYPNLEMAQNAMANLLITYNNLGQYDQLLSEYQKNITKIKNDEPSFPIHFAAVGAYIELKKYDQANSLLDQVLAIPGLKSSERAKIFIKKADILIREKKFKDALALLEAYSSENVDNADENLFLKAEAYFGVGDFNQALSFYENIYKNFPNSRFSKAAVLGEAHAQKGLGKYKDSEVLFSQYYALENDLHLKSEALYDAIVMAVDANDIAGAINFAKEYINIFVNGNQYSQVLLVLADCYGKTNQPQEAVNLLQEFLKKPEALQYSNSVYFLLGFNQQLLGKNDLALASYSQVDQAKEDGKFFLAALKNMAIIYLNQNKDDQAQMYFDQLISHTNDNDLQLKTYIWVCNEYLKQQKYQDVLRVATRAEKHFSSQDLVEIKYFKAEAMRALDSCDEAIKNYNFVISFSQKNAYSGSAHIGYGLCLAKDNKFDEAKKEFQKSLDENADDYTVALHARFELAGVDELQGSLDDAFKLYVLIATIYSDGYYSSESLMRAAKIAERQQRKADALKLYLEILDKYKNSSAAIFAKGRVGLLK